jgi:phenylalanyl-tRNA synthetase beta chain
MRAEMAALDYQEVINFSFVEEAWERDYCGNADPIRLLNPIASQLAVMRSSLVGGLLANIAHNAKHRQSRVRLFELGRVFSRDPSVKDGDLAVAGVAQPTHLAAAAWGPAVPEQWGAATRPVDFFDVKHDLVSLLGARAAGLRCEPAPHPALHPGRGARLILDGQPIGWLGEVHPRWTQALDLGHAPVVFELDTAAIAERVFPKPVELSRQPTVVRDLAVWLDAALPWQAILDTLEYEVSTDEALAVVKDIKLFDIWRDAESGDQRSLALRFWFQGYEATLDEHQIDYCMQRLTEALSRVHGARLRA